MSDDTRSNTALFNQTVSDMEKSVSKLHDISISNGLKLDTLTLAICGNPPLGIEGVVEKQRRQQRDHSELKLVVNTIVMDKLVLFKTSAFIAALSTGVAAVIIFMAKLVFPALRSLLPAIAAAFLLVGCHTTNQSRVTPPDLGEIAGSVEKADAGVRAAIKTTAHVLKYGAAKNDAAVKAMSEALLASQANLMDAQNAIKQKQADINNLTAEMNKVIDRVNYLEPKLALANSAIWKRNWIIVGLFALIGAYGFLKFYVHIPFF